MKCLAHEHSTDSRGLTQRLLLSVSNVLTAFKKAHCIFQSYSCPVHAMPEEFENGGFALKTHQTFSVHTTLEEFKTATITGHFGYQYVFEETSVREITLLSRHHRFSKKSVFKMFSIHTKTKSKISSDSSGVNSVFEKLCFSLLP